MVVYSRNAYERFHITKNSFTHLYSIYLSTDTCLDTYPHILQSVNNFSQFWTKTTVFLNKQLCLFFMLTRNGKRKGTK